MINPNIHKLVRVTVSEDRKTATYNGHIIEINDYRHPAPPPGSRRMVLRYSIMNDRYYLTHARSRYV